VIRVVPSPFGGGESKSSKNRNAAGKKLCSDKHRKKLLKNFFHGRCNGGTEGDAGRGEKVNGLEEVCDHTNKKELDIGKGDV